MVASRSPVCNLNLNYLPPRIYCECYMGKLVEYVQVEDAGTIESCKICDQGEDGKKLPEPVALVCFPNAHGGLVHKVKGSVPIGDRVQLVFKDKPKHTGSILDIEFLEKVT